MTDAPGSIYTQLAKAQAEFTQPKRTKQVKTASYAYMYAPLDEIIETVRPALCKHGLFLSQDHVFDGDRPAIRTRIHYGGECIESHWPVLAGKDGAQAHAGATTYARRYGVCALLGLAPEDDDDGNAAAGNTVTVSQRVNRNPAAPRLQVAPLPPHERSEFAPAHERSEFAPAHDPETGEIYEGSVEPHEITDHTTWVGWGGALITHLQNAKDAATMEAWIAANQVMLHDCEEESPKTHTRVAAQIKEARARLAEQPDLIDAPAA